jgi:DNA polymerase III alpha subunit
LIRSGFSFKVAYGHLQDVHARVLEVQYPAAPLADTCSTFGFVEWTKLCKNAGIKPVYGVELSVVPSLGEKKPVADRWCFLAKDNLRPLHDLIATATSNPGKEPSVLYSQALTAEGLIKIAGHGARLEHCRPRDDLFVALSPASPKGFIKRALESGHPLIARSDNFFPREEDQETYRVALGFRSSTQTYPRHILTDDEWREAVKWTTDEGAALLALAERDEVLARCQAQLKKAELLKPEKPKTLEQMCRDGAARLHCNLDSPIYAERLDKELSLINEKKFEDYFYIIADLINWAKERMIVGPARGSSCGSLVCYLLGITTIDPIPFGLIFERFIDINRQDLPDIDVDFSDARRHMVFEYAEQKYGITRVARLGTVGQFMSRSALKQVGAALKLPFGLVERTLEGVVQRSSGDSRAMNTLEDTMKISEAGKRLVAEYPNAVIAAKMEGHPNNASQHAAGIVITDQPLLEYVAIDMRTKSVMCDKKDAEELNLLKIDALGLTQLSIFERTLELIGKDSRNGFLESLPLDDELAFNVLNRKHFAGVFQFTGGALKGLVKQIKIECLEDMISITALARPGPMATGGAGAWARRRKGEERITTQHPMLTELTKDTYGIVVYQETVMNIVRSMGKMSWEDTSAIRKAMSGRLGNEFFEGYRRKFLAGALENGVEENVAQEIWDQINTFGSWAFNRSHAVAYGVVSYWTCWLKAHHPLEFAAATLDAEKNPIAKIQLLRELTEEGIEYIPVDPRHSTDRWALKEEGDRRMLVGPLTSIKGIGPATMREILDARALGVPVRETIMKKLESAQTEIDTLYPISEKIRELFPDLFRIGIMEPPTRIKDVQCGDFNSVVIIGVVKKIVPKDENEAVNVQKRGYAVKGSTAALNLFMVDDSDEIFCKVHRCDFERLARQIINHGRPGKAIWAIRGTVPKDFRMIWVKKLLYLGEMDKAMEDNWDRQGGHYKKKEEIVE